MRIVTLCISLVATISLFTSSSFAKSEYQLLKLDGYQVKWGKHGLGTGVTVQYAFIKTAMNFPDARNCRGLVPIDGLVAEAKVDATVFRAEVRAAFAMWESVADIHFQPTNDPSQAQILIGAEATPEGWAFTDVAYQHAGTSKVRTIERSLICLNPTRPWKVGFGGRSDAYDLRYVFTHEIGHAIGLDHPGPSGQVMSFCYGERFHELQNGDIAGVVALYGERPLSSETFTQSISISQPVSATE